MPNNSKSESEKKPFSLDELFRRVATQVSIATGKSHTFMLALLVIILWAATGPMFGFSDTWQLVINTGTTIVTFLMVFLIQNTQNRDARAVHLKLDELLRGIRSTRTGFVNIEDISDEELDHLQAEFRDLHEKYSMALISKAKRLAERQQSKLEREKENT